MELNLKKCFVLTFTRKQNVILMDYFTYSQVLQRVKEIKDLGVIFDEKLCFDKHVEFLFRKCQRLLRISSLCEV